MIISKEMQAETHLALFLDDLTDSELFIASLPICVLDFFLPVVTDPQNWISWVVSTEDTVEKGGVWNALFWQQKPNLK